LQFYIDCQFVGTLQQRAIGDPMLIRTLIFALLCSLFISSNAFAVCNLGELKRNMSWSYHNDQDGFRSVANAALADWESEGFGNVVIGYKLSQDHKPKYVGALIDECEKAEVKKLVNSLRSGSRYHE
jgi:hypothetical protein